MFGDALTILCQHQSVWARASTNCDGNKHLDLRIIKCKVNVYHFIQKLFIRLDTDMILPTNWHLAKDEKSLLRS